MKMNKLPCEIIQDLLPSYIDELTTEVTNRAVEEHLSTCKECEKKLKEMKGELNEQLLPSEKDKKEVSFLKKNSKRNRIIIASSTVAVFILIFTVLFNRYYVGVKAGAGADIKLTNSIENNILTIVAESDDLSFISDDKVENGVVAITSRYVAGSPLSTTKKTFRYDLSGGDINLIKFDNTIIWSHGELFDSHSAREAQKVFETKHAYVGDMSANQKSANALDLTTYLKSTYTNELETAKEPYGWKILMEEDNITVNNLNSRKYNMESAAFVLIGVIGNLDHVTFEFPYNGETQSYTVTAAEATEFLGQDIKNCGKDVEVLYKLINERHKRADY